ncbi:uncharacterized protein K02A2.6-like [Mercenaria mercenaria]|uniref:uncharacterized protein K02A2.6-like n=1 Tax=Mercenaria mercenaria TaxID=6596 RepID=UPI00234E790D|nr:uncharacterized protein K02A2.6-like [Mercenaria mercenaria]
MYVTKLRQKAEHCEFSDKDGEIKSQIIQGCVSKKLRIKCLEEEKELKDILILARSMEMAEKQAYAMDRHDSLPVNKIKKHPSQRRKPEILLSERNTEVYETAVELEIVPVIQTISSKNEKYSDLYDKYKPVFNGLGKLKDKQIKFHIDESVIPTAQPARRIPFHVRDKVAQELEKLEKLDVIEKATGATPWVSNLVVAPKPKSPNDVRICVDMRKANLALKRERHVVPTVDNIVMELNGSTVFSKVDLYKGFHQLELSEESRNMTVFASHVGLWRYKRLNFGVSVAPEIFQNEIRQVINGLNGVLNISDDIIIHGKTQNRS